MNYSRLLLVSLGLLGFGCAAEIAPSESTDLIGVGGKADSVVADTEDANALLCLANDPDALRAALSRGRAAARARDALLLHRLGADNRLGTADDDMFESVAEIDAVRGVGPATMAKLLEAGRANGWAKLPVTGRLTDTVIGEIDPLVVGDACITLLRTADGKTVGLVENDDTTCQALALRERTGAQLTALSCNLSAPSAEALDVLGGFGGEIYYNLSGHLFVSGGLTLAQLQTELEKVAEKAYWPSEADYTPEFVSAEAPAGPITLDMLKAAFGETLTTFYGADGETVTFDSLAFEMDSSEESAQFLVDASSYRADDDEYYIESAQAYARIKQLFDENLTDVRVTKVGPRDEEEGGLAVDQGLYVWLVVGRTVEGKLAGFLVGDVET